MRCFLDGTELTEGKEEETSRTVLKLFRCEKCGAEFKLMRGGHD